MYGYTAAILSIVIYALVYFTGNSAWSAGWFLMFLPFLVSSVREKRNRPKVVTYTDRMINETWRVIGVLFVFTVLTMIVLGFVIGRVNFGLMMPLALLYCGMGTSITGLVIKESSLTYFPLLALVTAIYMFMTMPSLHTPMVWQLYFGGSFVVMMVVPGHILNAKCKKILLKELDPLLHSQLRLAVMSILLSVDEADFVYLKEKTGATSGNLSVQIDKLSAAEYIRVRKEFVGKKTRTSCQITEKGREAFEAYVNTLKEYLNW